MGLSMVHAYFAIFNYALFQEYIAVLFHLRLCFILPIHLSKSTICYMTLQRPENPKQHSTILATFIKLPVVIKTFILFIFERPFLHRFYCILQNTHSRR